MSHAIGTPEELAERQEFIRQERLSRRRQLRRPVQIVPCRREYEFGPEHGVHQEISIIVWNADTEDDAARMLDEFLEHVRKRGWNTSVSGEEDETEGGEA
jgi:hypothetical protein